MSRQTIIDSPGAMNELTAFLKHASHIAIDTEFVWERTFYPNLGVVQVAASERDCFLIDAVALPSLPRLGEILEDPGITKILHDAQQDLIILHRATGALPRNIFNTQVAAGFAGFSSTTGLRALLIDAIDVEIPKTETRSNWLRRPLSTSQIAYALNDVRFLGDLKYRLEQRAEERGNTQMMQEELRRFDDPSLYPAIDPAQAYRRIKASRLRPPDLAVLIELATWRETTAQKKNLPRGRIAADRDLIALARARPLTRSAILNIKKLSPQLTRRFAGDVITTIKKAVDLPEDAYPVQDKSPRFSTTVQQRAREALDRIAASCQERGIDPALVATKAEALAIIADGPAADPCNHRPLRGWRKSFFPL